jgi:large subunit ribosomal protein L5
MTDRDTAEPETTEPGMTEQNATAADEPTAEAPTTDAPTTTDPMETEEPMTADEPTAETAEQPMAADAPAADDAPATVAGDTVAEESAAPEGAVVAEDEPAVDEPAAEEAAAPKASKAKGSSRTPKSDAEDRKAAATAGTTDEPAAAPARAAKPILPGPKPLRIRYKTEVVPALVKQFEYANPNQVPKLEKIVVNIGLGEALSNAKAVDAASGDLTMITGQKPIVTKARRSIAQFKIRTGNPIGLKVTLRGQRMWDFLERLILLTLPRFRDFRGTPSRSFDGRGNYSLGMREQIAFPEIDYDKVDRLRGLEVSIVTTAKSDEESKRLLELLGMPFAS